MGRTRFLAIARLDRQVAGTAVRTIHQEDAAQALGLDWVDWVDWVDDDAKLQDRRSLRRRDRPSARAVGEMFAGLSDEAGQEISERRCR